MAGNIRIGISGWRYEGWRGPYYPEGLPQRQELHFASRQVTSIEINGSFYSLQPSSNYRLWYTETPADFVFAVKGPRFITHIKRLKDVEGPLANFFASGILRLKEKLGPILWQLPPSFRYRADTVENFLAMLPHDTVAAASVSRQSDHHLKSRPYRRVDENRPLRHALEVRNQSFVDPGFIELLRAYGVALVFARGKKEWPYMEDVTADFIYVRLHGDKEVYVSGYGPKALDRWAERLNIWHAGDQPRDAETVLETGPVRAERDIYVYFDNDVKVRAPYDAMSLLKRMTDFRPAHNARKPDLKALTNIYGPRVTRKKK